MTGDLIRLAPLVFLRQILSEGDNQTFSFIRIGAVAFGLTAIVLAAVSVSQGHPFDSSGFLMGAAALLAGGGAGARLAEGSTTENKHDDVA